MRVQIRRRQFLFEFHRRRIERCLFAIGHVRVHGPFPSHGHRGEIEHGVHLLSACVTLLLGRVSLLQCTHGQCVGHDHDDQRNKEGDERAVDFECPMSGKACPRGAVEDVGWINETENEERQTDGEGYQPRQKRGERKESLTFAREQSRRLPDGNDFVGHQTSAFVPTVLQWVSQCEITIE